MASKTRKISSLSTLRRASRTPECRICSWLQDGDIQKIVANENKADIANVVLTVSFFLEGLDQSLSKIRIQATFLSPVNIYISICTGSSECFDTFSFIYIHTSVGFDLYHWNNNQKGWVQARNWGQKVQCAWMYKISL